MQDYQVLVDDKWIKIYTESTHAKETANLFREPKENDQRIAQNEFCTLRDNLFVTIEFRNADSSSICAEMLAGNQGQFLDDICSTSYLIKYFILVDMHL